MVVLLIPFAAKTPSRCAHAPCVPPVAYHGETGPVHCAGEEGGAEVNHGVPRAPLASAPPPLSCVSLTTCSTERCS